MGLRGAELDGGWIGVAVDLDRDGFGIGILHRGE